MDLIKNDELYNYPIVTCVLVVVITLPSNDREMRKQTHILGTPLRWANVP